MNKLSLAVLASLGCTLFSTQFLNAQVQENPDRKTAIIVANRAGDELVEEIERFEDFLSSDLNGVGLELISKELVLDAVSSLSNGVDTDLDSEFETQTSATRLSQALNADYLLFATISSYDTEKREVKAYNMEFTNYTYLLRSTYRLVDGTTGGTLLSGSVSPDRTIQQTSNSTVKTTQIATQLLESASSEIATKIERQLRTRTIRDVAKESSRATVSINATLSGVSFPDVQVLEDGRAEIEFNDSAIEATSVTVEVDGLAIGTTSPDAEFKITPGIHRIRLVRDDLVPWERMVNVYDGMNLDVAMELNSRGLNRWNDRTQMLAQLKNEAVVNQATAESLRGMAEMLRQSGYKVNITEERKEDIKVDTEEGVDIQNNTSLIDNDND